MQRFSWIVVLIVISGGIWFTSRYFYDEINDSKFYFVVVLSLLITLLYSISSKGFHTLRQGLNSRSFILGVSLIGLALSVHGLLQYAYIVPPHTVFPITGPFENPAGYVAVQCSCLPFSIYLCLHNKVSWSIRTLAIISSLLIILTIVLSGSRCGMLAASVAIVVILALETKAATYLKKHKSILLAIVLFFISGVFLLYKQRPTSADGRLLIWSVCWEMIKDKPITGFGINGFHANYMDYQAAYMVTHPDSPYRMLADNITHPFNEYILLTVQFGIIGLAMALAVLVFLIKNLWKQNGPFRSVGIAMIGASVVMCMFSYPYHYAVIWFMTLLLAIEAIPDRYMVPGKAIRYALVCVSFISLIGTGCMLYHHLKWAEMSRRCIAGQTERMLPHYEKMMPCMDWNPLFLYNYAAELNYVDRYEESLRLTEDCMKTYNDYDVQILFGDNLEHIGHIKQAITVYRHASDMIPNRFIPLESMMNLYQKTGDTINARLVAKEILAKPVKVPSPQVEEIKRKARDKIGSRNMTYK